MAEYTFDDAVRDRDEAYRLLHAAQARLDAVEHLYRSLAVPGESFGVRRRLGAALQGTTPARLPSVVTEDAGT